MKTIANALKLTLLIIVFQHSQIQAQPASFGIANTFRPVDSSRKAVVAKLKAVKPKQADSLYYAFKDEANTNLYNLDMTLYFGERYCRIKSDTTKWNAEDKMILQYMDKNDLDMRDDGEGSCYMSYKPYYFNDLFKSKVTPALRDYLKQRADEDTVLYSGDAAIAISFTELGERIIRWENFMKKYPGSKLKEDARETYVNYLKDFCFGQDNTPTFENDPATDLLVLNPENKQAFTKMINSHPGTKTAALVQRFVQRLKLNKFTLTPTMREAVFREIDRITF